MKRSSTGKKIYFLYVVIGLVFLICSFVIGFFCASKVNVDYTELRKYNEYVDTIRNNPIEFTFKLIFYTFLSALLYEVGRFFVDKKMGYRMRVEIKKNENKQRLTIDGLRGTMVKEGNETRKDRFMCKFGGLFVNVLIVILCLIAFKVTDSYYTKTSILMLIVINVVMVLFNLVRLFFTKNNSFVVMGRNKM